MTACPLDGSVRIVIDRDRYSTSYRCPRCQTVSREEVEPDVRNDLQREFR